MRKTGIALTLCSTMLMFACFAPLQADEAAPNVPAEYRMLYSQAFESADAVDDFLMTDAQAWKYAIGEGKNPPALELMKQSRYSPPFRSPVNIALVKDLVVGDCVIDVRCQQTGKEYGHRDMIFVFGYQSPSQYYYTHIATAADDHANQIFIVNEAPRRKISKESNKGNQWGLNEWHRVRIERKVSDGSIKVYFDDLNQPIMMAEDKTFGAGWVGFGSFDDTGKITDIRIFGASGEQKAAPPFARP